jgi:hypothetical protein
LKLANADMVVPNFEHGIGDPMHQVTNANLTIVSVLVPMPAASLTIGIKLVSAKKKKIDHIWSR